MPLLPPSRPTLRFLLAVLLFVAPAIGAQQNTTLLPGFTAAAAGAERMLEADAIARPDAARAREHSRVLSARTHVAGTPEQERTRDYVIAQMKAMGLETEVRR
jgi:N-acetylated-alpha-linked acidic dipeptidase